MNAHLAGKDTSGSPSQLLVGYRAAAPWRRFIARLVDFVNALLLLALLLNMRGDRIATLMLASLTAPILAGFLWIPVEALMLVAFATTPGKRMLHLKVERIDGARLSVREAFSRSLNVFIVGVACWNPFLWFLAAHDSYLRLTWIGDTPWDQNRYRVVKAMPAEPSSDLPLSTPAISRYPDTQGRRAADGQESRCDFRSNGR